RRRAPLVRPRDLRGGTRDRGPPRLVRPEDVVPRVVIDPAVVLRDPERRPPVEPVARPRRRLRPRRPTFPRPQVPPRRPAVLALAVDAVRIVGIDRAHEPIPAPDTEPVLVHHAARPRPVRRPPRPVVLEP